MINEIVVIADNIRSLYNVGSILRTCDGFGVKTFYATGITPYPKQNNDKRLPHVITRVENQLNKTALGAHKSVVCVHSESILKLIADLKSDGWQIIAIEQDNKSVQISDIRPSRKTAIILGNEVKGIDKSILDICDLIAHIPMMGSKESYNVAVCAGIALYHFSLNKG